MIVLGDRMQDRHSYFGNINARAANGHRIVEELVVPHQVFGDGAEVLAGQGKDVSGSSDRTSDTT